MTTEKYDLVVGGVRAEVFRRDIMHLHLGVYPPHGRVRIAAPLRLSEDAVRLAVVTRLAWIRRQQTQFQSQDRQSRREMVTGETHYLQGRRCRLRVTEQPGPARIRVRTNATIELHVESGTDEVDRNVALTRKYRRHLHEQLPELVAKWEHRMGVRVGDVRVRKMKTKWGSCNATARRIWLNLELAKKPLRCLEYILVHEMVHLLERHHSEKFRKLMDRFMPTWQLVRAELNRAPLAHEEWWY